jgi:hypothetical protein
MPCVQGSLWRHPGQRVVWNAEGCEDAVQGLHRRAEGAGEVAEIGSRDPSVGAQGLSEALLEGVDPCFEG